MTLPGLQTSVSDLDLIRVGRRKRDPGSPKFGETFVDSLVKYYPTSYTQDSDGSQAGLVFARWWYYRKGGCGRFEMLLRDHAESIWSLGVQDEEEVTIEVKTRTDTNFSVWYRGIVEIVRTRAIGSKVYTMISGMGYIKYLHRALVSQDYTSTLTSGIASSIVTNHVLPEARISSTSITAGAYTVNSFAPRTSALRAIKVLAELEGSVEWGVDEDRVFYWKNEDTSGVRATLIVNKHTHAVERVDSFERGVNKVTVQGDGNSATVEDTTRSDADGEKEELVQRVELSNTADLTEWGTNYIADGRASFNQHAVAILKVVPTRLCGGHAIGRIRLFDDKAGADKYYQLGKVAYEYGDLPATMLAAFPELGPVVTGGSTRERGGLRAKVYLGTWIKSLWEELEARDAKIDQFQQLLTQDRYVRVVGDTMTGNLTIDKTTPALVLDDDTGDDWHVRNNTGVLELWNATDGAAHMVVTSGADVGIGTTGPRGRLDIVSGAGLANTDGDAIGAGVIQGVSHNFDVSGLTTLALQSNVDMAANKGGSLGFGFRASTGSTAGTNSAAIVGAKENGTTGDTAGYLAFFTRPNGGGITHVMRIDSAGRVGIGTTAPSQKLDVRVGDGNGWVMVVTHQSDASKGVLIGERGGLAAIGTVGAVSMALNPDGGRVGIGTSGPDRKLDVLDATGPQMRLTYMDGSVYTDFQTDSAGDLIVLSTGNRAQVGSAATGMLLEVVDASGGNQLELTYALAGGQTTGMRTDASSDFHVDTASTPDALILRDDGDLEVNTDIEAAGGYRHSYTFHYINIAAGLSGTYCFAGDSAIDVFEFTMPFAGSIVGIGISIDNSPSGGAQAVSAGSFTATVFKNGATTGFALTMDSNNDPNAATTQAKDTDTFAAGDGISCVMTSTSSPALSPTTLDATITVTVEF